MEVEEEVHRTNSFLVLSDIYRQLDKSSQGDEARALINNKQNVLCDLYFNKYSELAQCKTIEELRAMLMNVYRWMEQEPLLSCHIQQEKDNLVEYCIHIKEDIYVRSQQGTRGNKARE